ncbi:MAG TPA: hypothetical protein VFI00_11185, partial [Kribbella sp.]|nr:hypothetical protein [Kribbella sp.]
MTADDGGSAQRTGAARAGVLVPSSDAFFLQVETAAAPQHVGGLVVFEPSDGDALSVERVIEL